MNTFDTVLMSFKSLRSNPTRTMLTMLGIIIGIGAVITMMEIGKGSSISIRTSIEKMGAGSGLIRPSYRRTGGVKLGSGTSNTLLPSDAEAVLRECPHVLAVSPIVRAGETQTVYGSANWIPAQMLGVGTSYFEIRNWELAEGRFFPSARSTPMPASAWSVPRSSRNFSTACRRSTARSGSAMSHSASSAC